MTEKKLYAVTYEIVGYATVLIEAESMEQALRRAEDGGKDRLVIDAWAAHGNPSVCEA